MTTSNAREQSSKRQIMSKNCQLHPLHCKASGRPLTDLNKAILASTVGGRRGEGTGSIEAMLLGLLPRLVEQEAQLVEGRTTVVRGLHVVGNGGKEASIYPRA